jgi:ATP-dependent RNA helicase HelY
MTDASRVADPVAAFRETLPFPLDDFQIKAIEALERGGSVLVAAPTGSGKTVVAEFACWLALQKGAKCFYTTPLKALSNQKFGDLVARHSARDVGLLTGDNTINGEGSLVVMTTEVLRNMLYEQTDTLRGLRWVVLDEVHYLQDPYRGAVWEEVLIHLPPEVRVVCLSATVSNAEEFGDWLATLRGPTEIVVERKRPVELRNLVMVGDQLYPLFAAEHDPDESARRAPPVNPDLVRAWARGTASAARYGSLPAGRPGHRGGNRAPGRGRPPRGKVFTPTRVEVAEVLDRERMLPAINFIFSRAGCDKAVDACIHADLRFTTGEEAQRIAEFAELRASDIDDDDLRALRFGTFIEGLRRGIAAHHAGILPIFKETVEELFALGLVRLVFATETLSLGINMPARTVVIERLTKFNGETHEPLTPTDYTQLTGRAGRRGIDEIGYAATLFDPWVQLDRLAALATVQTYELTSSFRPTYNMAVNLVRRHDHEEARHLLNSCFAQYTADREVVRWERRLAEREREIERVRSKAICAKGDIFEYKRIRDAAQDAMRRERGGEAVREAFARLVPGDVIAGEGIGRAVVLEQPRTSGDGPKLTVMTTDRKLRQVTPKDFRRPPEPLGKIALRGQSWRSPKVRRNIARELERIHVERPKPVDRRKVKELVTASESHPCHTCPDLEDHLEALRELERLEAEAAKLRKRVRTAKNTIAGQFERVIAVLEDLRHVDGWSLTEKGELLAHVYNESDLLVVECLTRGWLGGLDPEEFAAIASLFVYEARGRAEPESAPTPHLARYQRRIVDLYKSLRAVEDKHNVELLKEPDAGFMAQIYEWASGWSLEQVLHDRETSAGDFVRSAKQVVDLLQQLRTLPVNGELQTTLAEAVDRVQRGVVAYSSVV